MYQQKEKLFMQGTKTILTMIFFTVLLVGCAATGSVKTDTNELQQSNDIKTVSVSTFICQDHVIANNVRNMIIQSLLTSYSVVIGDEADVIIKGRIILSDDQFSTAPPGSEVRYISEINAQIINNNKTLDSAIITQVKAGSSTYDSPEAMGRKAGEKILEMLSNITNKYM